MFTCGLPGLVSELLAPFNVRRRGSTLDVPWAVMKFRK